MGKKSKKRSGGGAKAKADVAGPSVAPRDVTAAAGDDGKAKAAIIS